MSPTAEIRFSNVKGGMTPSDLAAEPATAKFTHLKPRSDPATLKSPPLSTASLVPEAAVKRSLFQKARSPLQTSLSGDWVNNDPAVDEPAEEEMDALRGLFTGQVRQRIARARYYPRIARRRGMEGQPVIAFTLDKRGRLTKVDLAQTSGYHLLDRAALEAVHEGAPYPEIPALLKIDSFQFKLPISFVLK
jgi:TonB family protein